MPTSAKKQLWQDIVRDVSVLVYLDHRDYLSHLYRRAKQKFKTYSYLRFAEDLGFSRTNIIHLVIQGKRPLTPKAAQRIIDSLGMAGHERRYFEAMVAYHHARTAEDRDQLFREMVAIKAKTTTSMLAKSQLDYFSEWYHPVVRELTALPQAKSEADWIADHIQPRIRPMEARRSLELLLSLGLLVKDPSTDAYRQAQDRVSTGDEIESIAIVRYHQKMIELAKESITSCDEALRDISAVTMSVSPATMESIKSEIQTFRKRMLMLAEQDREPNQVYQLNIQFFPMSKG